MQTFVPCFFDFFATKLQTFVPISLYLHLTRSLLGLQRTSLAYTEVNPQAFSKENLEVERINCMTMPPKPFPISLDALADCYSFATLGSIGKSLLGRDIPFLRIGNADCNFLYVAGISGCETLGEQILLLFAKELCEFIQKDRTVHGICPTYLVQNRSIYILPRVNPDGKEIALGTSNQGDPLYERRLRLNGMENDFSHWLGNARGIHPTQNLNYEFSKRQKAFWQTQEQKSCPMGEFPESEPESAALAGFARILKPNCLINIEKSENETPFFVCTPPHTAQTSALCRMTGLSKKELVPDVLGGWFHLELGRPSVLFRVNDRPEIAYAKLRDALLGACFLFCTRLK